MGAGRNYDMGRGAKGNTGCDTKRDRHNNTNGASRDMTRNAIWSATEAATRDMPQNMTEHVTWSRALVATEDAACAITRYAVAAATWDVAWDVAYRATLSGIEAAIMGA